MSPNDRLWFKLGIEVGIPDSSVFSRAWHKRFRLMEKFGPNRVTYPCGPTALRFQKRILRVRPLAVFGQHVVECLDYECLPPHDLAGTPQSEGYPVGGHPYGLDIPLSHKDDSWSFDHFDTVTVSMPDAPKPDEIVVVLVIADGGRPHPRCGNAPR